MASRNYSVKFSSQGLQALVRDLKQTAQLFDSVLADSQKSVDQVLRSRSEVLNTSDLAAFKSSEAEKVRIAQSSKAQILGSYLDLRQEASRITSQFASDSKRQFQAWGESLADSFQFGTSRARAFQRNNTPRVVAFRQEETVVPRVVVFNSPFKGGSPPASSTPDYTKLAPRDRALVEVWRNEYRNFFTEFKEELKGELKDALQKDDGLGLVGRVISTPFNLIGDLIKFPIEATLLGVFSGFGEKLSADFSKGFATRLEKGMGVSLQAVGEDVGDIVGQSVYRTYEASLKAIRKMILSQSPDKMPQVGELIEDIKKILLGTLLQSAAVPIKAHKRIQINKKALPQVMSEAGNLLINQEPDAKEIEEIEKQKSITLLVGGVNNDPTAGNTEYVNRLLKPLVGESHVVPVKNFWSNSKIGEEFKEVVVGLIKNIFSNEFLSKGAVDFLKNQGFEKSLNFEQFKDLSLDDKDKFIQEIVKFFESGKLPFGRLLESAYQGFNPDDIMIAAQALYYKQHFPDKPLNIVGTSGGGFNVAGAIEMLNKLGYKDVKGVGITTPFTGLEFTSNPEDFYASLGTRDPYYQMTFGSTLKGLLDPPDFMQIVPGAGMGHLLASYVGTPEFQNFFQYFFRDRIKVPKGMGGDVMNYISRRVQNPEDENLQRTLLKLFGQSTEPGYTFNAYDLAGLTQELKKKSNKIKDKDIKKEAQIFIDFLDTLAEELKIVSVLGEQFKPFKSLRKAAKVYPELKDLAAQNQPTAQNEALEKAVKAQLEVNQIFINFKAKIKAEAENIQRTLQALRGQQVEGYAYYHPEEYETRANEHLGGLINHLESDLLKGATPKQQAKAYKYIDYLKRLQSAILAPGKSGVIPPELDKQGQELFEFDLGEYTYLDYLKSLQSKKAQSKKLATEYNNYLQQIVQQVRETTVFSSVGDSSLSPTIETIKTRMREYREAIANSQHEIAKNLGETLLADLERAKQTADATPQEIGTLTRYQNEILRGEKGKGRAQIGLTQLAQSNPSFQALLGSRSNNAGFARPGALATIAGISSAVVGTPLVAQIGQQLISSGLLNQVGSTVAKSTVAAAGTFGQALSIAAKSVSGYAANAGSTLLTSGAIAGKAIESTALLFGNAITVAGNGIATASGMTIAGIKAAVPLALGAATSPVGLATFGAVGAMAAGKALGSQSVRMFLEPSFPVLYRDLVPDFLKVRDRAFTDIHKLYIALDTFRSSGFSNLVQDLNQKISRTKIAVDTFRFSGVQNWSESARTKIAASGIKLDEIRFKAQRSLDTFAKSTVETATTFSTSIRNYLAKKITDFFDNLSKQASIEIQSNNRSLRKQGIESNFQQRYMKALPEPMLRADRSERAPKGDAEEFNRSRLVAIAIKRKLATDLKEGADTLKQLSAAIVGIPGVVVGAGDSAKKVIRNRLSSPAASLAPTFKEDPRTDVVLLQSQAKAIKVAREELGDLWDEAETVVPPLDLNRLIQESVQIKEARKLLGDVWDEAETVVPPVAIKKNGVKLDPKLSSTSLTSTKQKFEELFEWIKQQYQKINIGQIFQTPSSQNKKWLDQIFNSQGIDSTLDEGFGNLFDSFGQFFERLEEQFPIFGRFKGAIADLAVNLLALFGVFTAGDIIIRAGQSALEAARKFEQLDRVIVSASGSAEKGAANLKFVAAEAKRLSLDLEAAKSAYGQLLASAQGSALEGGQINQIFSAVGEATVNKGLDKEGQSRAFLAIQQMISKGKVSAEELRQQLGEALPGTLQTAARALGVTTQQLDKMLESGQLLATDFLPKFAAQLSAENASGVAGSANTAQAAVTRFNNALAEFQRAMGEGAQPAQKLGLNTLSVVLDSVRQEAELLGKVLIALVLLVGYRLVEAFLKSVAAGKLAALGITSIKDAILKALPAIKQFLAEMILVTAAIQAWVNVYQLSQDSFKDIADYANASAKGLDNLARAYQEASGAASDFNSKSGVKRDRDLISRGGPEIFGVKFNLDTMYRKPIDLIAEKFGGHFATQGEREYNDFLVNAGNLISRSYDNTTQSLNAKNAIADIQKIDRELEKLRSKRFDLLPGDREGLQKSIEQEQTLLAEREKLLKITSTIQSNFARDAENIKKTLEAIDRLPEGADTDRIRTDLENALNDTKKSQAAFDGLISSVSRGISEMDRRMRDLNESTIAFNENLDLQSQRDRANIINQGVAEGRDQSKVQFDLQNMDRENLKLKVAKLQDDIAKIRRDLASPAMSETVKNLGIDPTTVGSTQLDRMLSEGRSEQEQSALKAVKKLKESQQQLSAATEQLATSGQQLQTTLKEFTLQLIDFYTQLRRQVEDLGAETEKAIQQLKEQFNAANLEIESSAQSILLTNFKGLLTQPLLTQAQRLLNGTNDAFEQYIQSLMGGLEHMFQQAGLDTQLKQQIEQINNQITGLKTSQEDRVRALQRQQEDKQKEYQQLQRSSPSESFGGNPTGNNSTNLLTVPSQPPAGQGELPPPDARAKQTGTNRSQYRARIAAGESSGGTNLGDRALAENNDAPYGEYQFRKSTRDIVLQRHGIDAWSQDKQQRDRAVDAWIEDYGKEIGVNILKLIDEGNFQQADLLLGRNQFTSLPNGREASPLWRNQKNLAQYGPVTASRASFEAAPTKQTASNASSNPLNGVVEEGIAKLPEWANYAIASTEQATQQNIQVLEQKKRAVTDLTSAQEYLNDVEENLATKQRQNQLVRYIDEQTIGLQSLNDQLTDLNDKYKADTPVKQHEAALRGMNAEYRQLDRQLKNQTKTLSEQKKRFEETASALKDKVIPGLQEYQQKLIAQGDKKQAGAYQKAIDYFIKEAEFLESQIPQIEILANQYEAQRKKLPDIFNRARERQQTQFAIEQQQYDLDKERTLNESGFAVLDAQASLLQSQGDEFGSKRLAKSKAIASENARYTQQVFDIDKDVALNPTKYSAAEVEQLKLNAEELNKVNLQQINEQFKDLGQTITETSKGALTQFFEGIFTNTESVGEAFRNMALTILRSIAQIAAQQVVLNIFGKATGSNDGFLGLFKQIIGHADGGLVTGEGTGTSDSIVRRLSNGEFVVRAAAVKHWGTDFLHDLNAMRQPSLAFAASSIGSAGNSRSVSNPTIVMNVSTPDANSFRRSEMQIGRDAGEQYRRALYRNS